MYHNIDQKEKNTHPADFIRKKKPKNSGGGTILLEKMNAKVHNEIGNYCSSKSQLTVTCYV